VISYKKKTQHIRASGGVFTHIRASGGVFTHVRASGGVFTPLSTQSTLMYDEKLFVLC